MRLSALMFLLGILSCQQLAALPAYPLILLVPVVLGGLPFTVTRPLAMALAGFVWAGIWGGHVLAGDLDPALEGKDVMIEGVISSIPAHFDRASRFDFRISRWEAGGVKERHPEKIRLSWYGSLPHLRAGERWRLRVRLKRPHGFMNPGGFRYEDWLFSHGIRATGYVRSHGENLILGRSERLLDRLQGLRQRVFEHLQEVMGKSPMTGIVIALAMGERQEIDSAQWQVLTRTGTSHLVAISGLHIGLAAGGCYWLVQFLWSRLGRLPIWLPAPKAAAAAALLGAAVYAALAGFSLPTQRALIMVGVGMAAIALGNRYRASHAIALALMAVLVYDPLSVQSPGFWLSFGAVALILLSLRHRLQGTNIWWRWVRTHVLLAIGLAPILAYHFQLVPTYAPIANLLAVPWVAFLIVPLTFLGLAGLVLSVPLGAAILGTAKGGMTLIWLPLAIIADWPGSQWNRGVPLSWSLLPALTAILLIVSPRGMPARSLAPILLLPLILYRPERPEVGGFRLALLDVGQGLAAVIRTHDHVLVYDTGPRYGGAFDAGRAVIAPYLRNEGINRIDTVVISHGDRDHLGGFESLSEMMPIASVVTSIPDTLASSQATLCQQGTRWVWDGVVFEFLHPSAGFSGSENNRSCVLKVGAPGLGLLLPGDIEAPAETALVAGSGEAMRARVLVAPHHGSETSSTAAFLRAIEPDTVLFPAGYRNRFGFPRPAVVERYRRLEAALYDTAHDGAIQVDFSRQGDVDGVTLYRPSIRRYWHWPTYFNDPGEGSMMGR